MNFLLLYRYKEEVSERVPRYLRVINKVVNFGIRVFENLPVFVLVLRCTYVFPYTFCFFTTVHPKAS